MQVLCETHAEKCARRRWGFVLWVLAVVLFGAWASSTAASQMRVQTATLGQYCYVVWDFALVARALAQEGVEEAKQDAVMRQVFGVEDGGNKIMGAIVAAARRSTEPAGEFAGRLRQGCYQHRGNMGPVLGVGV